MAAQQWGRQRQYGGGSEAAAAAASLAGWLGLLKYLRMRSSEFFLKSYVAFYIGTIQTGFLMAPAKVTAEQEL